MALAACQTTEAQVPREHASALKFQEVAWSAGPSLDEDDLARFGAAMARSCQSWRSLDENRDIHPGYGRFRDWKPLCEQAESGDLTAEWLETNTVLLDLTEREGPETGTVTAYYEPRLEARRSPEPGFEAAVPAKPDDLGQITLRGRPGERPLARVFRQTETGEAYPPRAEIDPDPEAALGWVDPAELYFLQIQGSGRLRFPDGEEIRAAFAAHNSHPYRSLAHALLERGDITRAQMSNQGIKAYLRALGPEKAFEAMALNPRYVFFAAEPLGDPELGARGAQRVPLTPWASAAVDQRYVPLGAPVWLDVASPALGGAGSNHGESRADGWSGFVVAQDVGGAIKGPLRADLYVGIGDEAGRVAERVKADARWRLLAPRAVADALIAGSRGA